MSRLFAVLLVVAALSVTAVFAQITIHQNDWRGIGSVYTQYQATDVACSHGPSGANQTWTLPNESWSTSTENWVAPSATPFAGEFPSATFATTEPGSDSYTYIHITSSGAFAQGTATVSGDSSIIYHYANEAMYLPFPATYNTVWTTVTRFSMVYVDTIHATFVDSVIHTMDAWGTLVTPLAENVATVRSQNHEFLNVYYMGIPFLSQEFYGYTWIAQDGRAGATMQQPSSDPAPNPNFTTGDVTISVYSGQQAAEQPRGPVAKQFAVGQNYPNPFNPTTSLPIELTSTAKVTLTVYDETGRLVSSQEMELPAGAHQLPIDGANWATGTYFARVSAEGQSLSTKMMLLK